MARVTTIGVHGQTFLTLLYRYGALTRVQLMALSGVPERSMDRQLRYLEDAGYVAQARDAAGWKPGAAGRPKSAYYLVLPAGVKAAAFYSGIENDYLAPKNYRRVGVPAKAAHRVLGNEYLIAVAKAAKNEDLKAEEIFSESCPTFPMFGTGTPKSDRADSPYRFSRIVPDGTFDLDGQTYLLEVETGTHARKELVSKLGCYAGRWRRMLRPNLGERKFHNPRAKIESLIILTPSPEHKRMRDYLRKHLPDAPDWAEADALIKAVSGGEAEAGRLVIVAGIDEVRDDPLGRVYRPLYRYPEEHSDPAPSWAGGQTGWGVSLADAAAISARIPVPEKPPKLGPRKPSKKKEKGAA